MPNHIHGIIIIEFRSNIVGANCNSPLHNDRENMNKLISPSQTLGTIIRGFTVSVTKRINELRTLPGYPVWQRNYYEHILRNETDIFCTRQYIQNNPLNWELDNLFNDENCS
jgi:putative transposase